MYIVAYIRAILLSCLWLYIAGCTNYGASAPVRDINTHQIGKTQYHIVQAGETLYAVAWRYEKDYRDLAALNNLRPPYAIRPGELIKLTGSPAKKAKMNKAKFNRKITTTKTSSHAVKIKLPKWHWPTRSHLLARTFSRSNKGIDIIGSYKAPVFASASGKVVYAGNGLRGYGNLLIIKHSNLYLTAYAYNNKLLVKQGAWVKAKQKIALMGVNNNLKRVSLHFEIRRAGKAVNPLRYMVT